MAALKYWLWLTTAPALSNRAKLLLLEHFSSPEDVYYAQPDQLCLVEGITRQQAESLSDKSLARAEKVLADCARDGQFIVTMDDAAYPARLRDMYDPPVLLYGKGSMPLFDEEAAVAVVGTRKCSPYGTRAASQLGYELARQGGLVISGLAKGIDGAAHQGALRAGGFTAAVLGGGADVIYPPENRRLYEDIAATGVLLSEYPPGTEPRGGHFPVRNRIISGLSLAVVVVEAPEKSGALITANTALEQEMRGMAALKYWLWLTTAPALSNRAKLLLLEHFSSPEDVYYAQPDQLCLVEGITRQQAESLSDKSLARAEKVLADCARDGQFIVTMDDAAYPARLRDMYDPPVLLYGKGSMPLFDEEAAVAVVGTRKCSPYGTRAASQLGYELARQGGLVISGLAKGIDGAAHQGALRAGGFTAAVLGGGADVIYPPENRRLYEDIAATGVLLSEYPPGTEPRGGHFPVRNRIISGLSLAVVVVEAPEKSGALITANTALEQGRDVFAVPGPINAASSRGCNQLIRDGAGLVMEAWDVLGTYQQRFPQKLRPIRAVLPETPGSAEAEPASASAQPVRQPEKAPALPILNMAREGAALTDDQQRILRMLPTDRPLLADEAAVATDLPVRRVLSALTMLEIDGYVCRQGAGSFLRTVELKEE